ncbi:hypothetical protein GCM10027168_26810 [Streptomyces capparidis]
MLKNRVVVPTCLPLAPRRCHTCASERLRASGAPRPDANRDLIHARLLALLTACGQTARLTTPERVHVRSVRPELLARLHDIDPGLKAELLRDAVARRRRRVAGAARGREFAVASRTLSIRARAEAMDRRRRARSGARYRRT